MGVSSLRFQILTCHLLPVTFETFDLHQLVESAYGNITPPVVRVPESVTNWLDERPRMALDAKGVPLVLHIPMWQRETSLVCKLVRSFKNVLLICSTKGYLQ